jgi:cytochrome P450 family 4
MLIITWIGWILFIASLLSGLVVVYYWVWSKSRFVCLVNAIPGTNNALPFLGNILELNVDHDGNMLRSCDYFCYKMVEF